MSLGVDGGGGGAAATLDIGVGLPVTPFLGVLTVPADAIPLAIRVCTSAIGVAAVAGNWVTLEAYALDAFPKDDLALTRGRPLLGLAGVRVPQSNTCSTATQAYAGPGIAVDVPILPFRTKAERYIGLRLSSVNANQGFVAVVFKVGGRAL